MSSYLRLCLLLAASGVSTGALAQSLTLYSGTNFSGESKQVSIASTNVGGFVARSAVATGKWRVCTGPYGLLGCRTIEGRVADLGANGMAVSSAVFGLGTGGTGQQAGTTPAGNAGYPPQYGVVLYSGPNYTGQQLAVHADTGNLSAANFGDIAQSALVAANESWLLCEHANYDGQCITLTGAMPSLVPLSAKGSSLRRASATTNPLPSQYPSTAQYPVQQGYGAAVGRTASFFPQPMFNGQPMLACPSAPTKVSASCAKKNAEQFCTFSGFRKLAYSSYSAQGYLEDVLCTK